MSTYRIDKNGYTVLKFKRGDITHLDSIYFIQGLIPNDCWESGEDANERGEPFKDILCNEAGDNDVRFLKDVEVSYKVIVKD